VEARIISLRAKKRRKAGHNPTGPIQKIYEKSERWRPSTRKRLFILGEPSGREKKGDGATRVGRSSIWAGLSTEKTRVRPPNPSCPQIWVNSTAEEVQKNFGRRRELVCVVPSEERSRGKWNTLALSIHLDYGGIKKSSPGPSRGS